MGRQLKFVFGISLILLTVGYLVWTSVDQTKMYMITVPEFLGSGEAYANETVRIAGKVAPGSVKYESASRDLRFTVIDMEGKPGEVKVQYSGLLPDMFAEDRDVVVEGVHSRSDPFRATKVMTSCPSKYQSKDANPS
jgi:cytochrome c-type biogenesis protein CcmE